MRASVRPDREPKSRNSVLSSRPEYLLLGEWIARQREAQGLGQKPLSRALGKPEQFLNKVERGRQRLDLVEFFDLMNRLNPSGSKTFLEFLDKVGAVTE